MSRIYEALQKAESDRKLDRREPEPRTPEVSVKSAIYATAVATAGDSSASVTLTINWKPTPAVKIQPEIRWNHSTIDTALNGKSDQFIVGCGVSYAF